MNRFQADKGPHGTVDLPYEARKEMFEYIEKGVRPSGFLVAILTSNVYKLAELDNYKIGFEKIVKWLQLVAPDECHGSVKEFNAWMLAKGHQGIYSTNFFSQEDYDSVYAHKPVEEQ